MTAPSNAPTKVIPISPIARLKQLTELGICKHHCTVTYCDTYDMFKCDLITDGNKTFTGYARKFLWACEVAALKMLEGANANFAWRSVGNTMTSAPLPFPDDYLSDIPDRLVTNGLKCLTGMQRSGLLKFTINEVKNWASYHECVMQIGACTYTISGSLETIHQRAADFAVAFFNVDAKQMERLGELLEDAPAVTSLLPNPTSVVINAPKTEHERVFDALATGVRAVPGFSSEVEDFITRLCKMVKDGSLTQERSNRMLLHVLQETVSGRWVVADSIFDGGYSGKIIRKTLEEPAKPLPVGPQGWSLVDDMCVKPTKTTPPKPIAASGATSCDACPKGTIPVNKGCVSVNSVEYSKRTRDFSADVKAVPSTAGNQATSVVLTEKEYELFGKPLSSTPVEPKTTEATSSKPEASLPAPSPTIDPKTTVVVANIEARAWSKLVNFRKAMDSPKAYLYDLESRQAIKSFEYKTTRFGDGVMMYVEITLPGEGEPMRFGQTGHHQDAFQHAAVTLFHVFG